VSVTFELDGRSPCHLLSLIVLRYLAPLCFSAAALSNFTMAHIHIGNATENGPILVVLVPVGEGLSAVRWAGFADLPKLQVAFSRCS
jgi:hypothetical protein